MGCEVRADPGRSQLVVAGSKRKPEDVVLT